MALCVPSQGGHNTAECKLTASIDSIIDLGKLKKELGSLEYTEGRA
jgi:hypothetical protein